MHFQHSDIAIIQQAIAAFELWFQNNVTRFFHIDNFGNDDRQPSEWAKLKKELEVLQHQTTKGGVEGLTLADEYRPLLKRVLIVRRREEADRIRKIQERTHHLELLAALDADLNGLDELTRRPWFREATPREVPSAVDFLPIQRVEEQLGMSSRFPPRKYDEKFHILQAPELFLQDLEYYRSVTDLRGTYTSVAFIDIDDFKKFNSENTETRVDRNMLPRFMRLLEAHVHFHGQCYRQGGDEYLMLLPGLSPAIATDFLDELRIKVSKATYPGIANSATVSIGLCVADPDCHLTSWELQQMANIAKELAKGTPAERAAKTGKNRIATYEGNGFTDADLKVVRPAAGPSSTHSDHT